MKDIHNPPAIVQSLSRSIEQLTIKAAGVWATCRRANAELGGILCELRDKCAVGEWLPLLAKLGIPRSTAHDLMQRFKAPEQEGMSTDGHTGQDESVETGKNREDISEPFVPEDERGDAWEPPAESPSNPAAGRRGFSPSYARNPAYEESKRSNGKGAKPPSGPKAGSELFNIRQFEGPFGQLVRAIDDLGKVYKQKESPQAKKLRDALTAYHAAYHAWYESLTGGKK